MLENEITLAHTYKVLILSNKYRIPIEKTLISARAESEFIQKMSVSCERFINEAQRLSSFNTERFDAESDYYHLPVESLARNGFFKDCSNPVKSVIKCAFCCRVLKKKPGYCDNVVKLHYYLNRRCSLYLPHDLCGNEPLNSSVLQFDVECFQKLADEDKKLQKLAAKVKREKRSLTAAITKKCEPVCTVDDDDDDTECSLVDDETGEVGVSTENDKKIKKLIKNYLTKKNKRKLKSKAKK